MNVVVGRTLDLLRVRIVYGSEQSFALEWSDENEVPLDLSGKIVRIICPTFTWNAQITGNRTQWNLTALQSRVSTCLGRLEIVGTDTIVAYSVSVELQ